MLWAALTAGTFAWAVVFVAYRLALRTGVLGAEKKTLAP